MSEGDSGRRWAVTASLAAVASLAGVAQAWAALRDDDGGSTTTTSTTTTTTTRRPGVPPPDEPTAPTTAARTRRSCAATAASSGPLRLEVTAVAQDANGARVALAATNRGTSTITLAPADLQVRDQGGTALQGAPGPFLDVPGGATVRRELRLDGRLADGARTLAVAFPHVFGSFDVSAITVDGVRLDPC